MDRAERMGRAELYSCTWTYFRPFTLLYPLYGRHVVARQTLSPTHESSHSWIRGGTSYFFLLDLSSLLTGYLTCIQFILNFLLRDHNCQALAATLTVGASAVNVKGGEKVDAPVALLSLTYSLSFLFFLFLFSFSFSHSRYFSVKCSRHHACQWQNEDNFDNHFCPAIQVERQASSGAFRPTDSFLLASQDQRVICIFSSKLHIKRCTVQVHKSHQLSPNMTSSVSCMLLDVLYFLLLFPLPFVSSAISLLVTDFSTDFCNFLLSLCSPFTRATLFLSVCPFALCFLERHLCLEGGQRNWCTGKHRNTFPAWETWKHRPEPAASEWLCKRTGIKCPLRSVPIFRPWRSGPDESKSLRSNDEPSNAASSRTDVPCTWTGQLSLRIAHGSADAVIDGFADAVSHATTKSVPGSHDQPADEPSNVHVLSRLPWTRLQHAGSAAAVALRDVAQRLAPSHFRPSNGTASSPQVRHVLRVQHVASVLQLAQGVGPAARATRQPESDVPSLARGRSHRIARTRFRLNPRPGPQAHDPKLLGPSARVIINQPATFEGYLKESHKLWHTSIKLDHDMHYKFIAVWKGLEWAEAMASSQRNIWAAGPADGPFLATRHGAGRTRQKVTSLALAFLIRIDMTTFWAKQVHVQCSQGNRKEGRLKTQIVDAEDRKERKTGSGYPWSLYKWSLHVLKFVDDMPSGDGEVCQVMHFSTLMWSMLLTGTGKWMQCEANRFFCSWVCARWIWRVSNYIRVRRRRE